MAIIDWLVKDLLIGQKIVDIKYDFERDEFTITTENGLKLVVTTEPTPGADGGMYTTLHIRTVVGG